MQVPCRQSSPDVPPVFNRLDPLQAPKVVGWRNSSQDAYPMIPTRQTFPADGPSPAAISTLYLVMACFTIASPSTDSGICAPTVINRTKVFTCHDKLDVSRTKVVACHDQAGLMTGKPRQANSCPKCGQCNLLLTLSKLHSEGPPLDALPLYVKVRRPLQWIKHSSHKLHPVPIYWPLPLGNMAHWPMTRHQVYDGRVLGLAKVESQLKCDKRCAP